MNLQEQDMHIYSAQELFFATERLRRMLFCAAAVLPLCAASLILFLTTNLRRYLGAPLFIAAGCVALTALVLLILLVRDMRQCRKLYTDTLPLTPTASDYLEALRRSFSVSGHVRRILLTLLLDGGILAVVLANGGAVLGVGALICLALLPVVIIAVYSRLMHNALLRLPICRISSAQETVPEKHTRRRELVGAVLYTVFLWGIALGCYIPLCIWSGSLLVFSYIPAIAAALYALHLLICNPFSPFSAFRRRKASIRILRVLSLFAVIGSVVFANVADVFLLMDYAVSRPTAYHGDTRISYDKKEGVYTLSQDADEEFRILQLTDIHLGGSLTTYKSDKQALACCERLIRIADPDLVVVTGDLLFPLPLSSFTANSRPALLQFCFFMESLGVPWVFVYGNHDTEKTALLSADDINETMFFFSNGYDSERVALMADVQPDISGRYNQYLRVTGRGGKTSFLLFLMDSGAYLSDGAINGSEYDRIHDDQIAWYAETVRRYPGVPSLIFFHIPIEEYRAAAQALDGGQPDARYLFGENGEMCSCPAEESDLFETALALGSTKAMFCGHDHLNNLGVNYRGIDLVYGLSVDYLAYPGIAEKTSQRGGTLIILRDGGYRIEQLHDIAPSS